MAEPYKICLNSKTFELMINYLSQGVIYPGSWVVYMVAILDTGTEQF